MSYNDSNPIKIDVQMDILIQDYEREQTLQGKCIVMAVILEKQTIMKDFGSLQRNKSGTLEM